MINLELNNAKVRKNKRELKLTKPIVFLDLETTGLDTKRDRIIEICLIKLHANGTKEMFSTLINPEMPISVEATEKHNLTDEDVADKSPLKEYANNIVDFIGDSDLSGYNLEKFDLEMIENELKRVGVNWTRKERHIVDVMRIFHKLEPRSLTAAYKKYCDKDHENSHRAEQDVNATIEVIQAMLEKHSELPIDVPSLNQYTINPKYIDRGGKFIWVEGEATINFGKHKGMTLRKMVMDQEGYLKWMKGDGDFSNEVQDIVNDALKGKFPQARKVIDINLVKESNSLNFRII